MLKDKNTKDLTDFIKSRCKKNLPGIDAYSLMIPMVGDEMFRNYTAAPDAKESAVLLLLNFNDKLELPEIIFTLRNNTISHGGQISFPGGRQEGNETAIETALREAHEEIGLASDRIEILGQLSKLYVPPSKYFITPVIARIDDMGEMKANPDEVDEIFKVPLEKFLQADTVKIKVMNLIDQDVDVPYWDVHPTTPLWGATAMIMSEFVTIVREFLD